MNRIGCPLALCSAVRRRKEATDLWNAMKQVIEC